MHPLASQMLQSALQAWQESSLVKGPAPKKPSLQRHEAPAGTAFIATQTMQFRVEISQVEHSALHTEEVAMQESTDSRGLAPEYPGLQEHPCSGEGEACRDRQEVHRVESLQAEHSW